VGWKNRRSFDFALWAPLRMTRIKDLDARGGTMWVRTRGGEAESNGPDLAGAEISEVVFVQTELVEADVDGPM
jgi:hypothetical protein